MADWAILTVGAQPPWTLEQHGKEKEKAKERAKEHGKEKEKDLEKEKE